MKQSFYIIAILFLFFSNSCKNYSKESKDSEIESVVMNIQKAKGNTTSLILILDLNSKSIIICNSTLETPQIPPPPPSSVDNNFEYVIEKIDAEIITLRENEINNLKELLSDFGDEDYKNRYIPSLDGLGISMTFILADNQIKEVDLVNDSTNNQIIFFKSLFKYISQKSKNSEYIKNIYPETFFQ